MDVAGGVRLNYKIDLNKYKQAYTNSQEYAQVTRNVKNIILKNIDTRISKLGVSDYESYLQTIGDEEFVIIEIGGVSDLDQAKGIIGKTVELEFKTAYSGTGEEMKTERKALVDELLTQAKTAPTTMQDIATPLQSDQVYFARHEKKTLEQLPDIYTAHTELLTSAAIGTVQLTDGIYTVIPPMSGLTTTETSIAGWTIFRLVEIDTLTGASDAS